jgi:hypothetical protein
MQTHRLGNLVADGEGRLRELIGSWKIIEISLPRSCASRAGVAVLRSSSLNARRLTSMVAPRAGKRPITAMDVTLLPEPDSPTRQSVLPAWSVKEISDTAWVL